MLYFADFHSDPVGRDDGATEEEEEEDGRVGWGWQQERDHFNGLVQESRNQAIDLSMNIHGLVQDCSNSIANALELLQSCTKPSIYYSVLL